MPFDIRGAKAAGYSDAEIMAFMQQPRMTPQPAPPPRTFASTMQEIFPEPYRGVGSLTGPPTTQLMGGPVVDPEEFTPTPTSVAWDLVGAALPPGARVLGKALKAAKAAERLPAILRIEKPGTSMYDEGFSHMFEGMPTGVEDFTAAQLARYKQPRFGFPDMTTLRNWITPQSMAELSKAGYKIRRYRVPHTKGQSGQQVIFEPPE